MRIVTGTGHPSGPARGAAGYGTDELVDDILALLDATALERGSKASCWVWGVPGGGGDEPPDPGCRRDRAGTKGLKVSVAFRQPLALSLYRSTGSV